MSELPPVVALPSPTPPPDVDIADATLPTRSLPPDAFHRVTRQAERLFRGATASVACAHDGSIHSHGIAEGRPDAALVRQALDAQAPFVAGPGERFFASVPIVLSGGRHAGALCVCADAPRPFDAADAEALSDLAALAALEWRFYRDGTDRRHAEAALRASEERARLLVQHLSDVICVIEPSGVLTYVSPSCERLLGCAPEALCGRRVFDFIHPDDLAASVLAFEVCALEQGVQPPLDFRWQRPDGSFVALEALGHNLLHEPTLRGIVVTVRDATERRRAIAALEQSLEKERQVNELRASFVAMASHEFRTPLATILSSANLAARFLDKSREKTDKHLQRISQTVQDMLALLNDILELERLGTDETRLEPQPLDLPDLLDELFGELRFGLGSGHHFQLTGTPASPLAIDRVTLRLILSNLLTNAVKYSPAGSTVTLDVSRPEPGAPVVSFRVTDHGIGIPENEMPLLFEPFHRAANVGTIQGTGLGLSMVKQAVDRCGGTIQVSSAVGAGTSVEVILPVRPRRA